MDRRTKQLTLRGKSINCLFILSARHSAVKNKDKSWMVSLRSLPCSSSFHQIKFEWKGRESCGGRKEINQIHLLHSFMRMKMDWLTFLPLISWTFFFYESNSSGAIDEFMNQWAEAAPINQHSINFMKLNWIGWFDWKRRERSCFWRLLVNCWWNQ